MFFLSPTSFGPPPRLFETSSYIYLALRCLAKRVGIKSLAKANYGLDHGEIGIGSKYKSQLAFDQQYSLPTVLIEASSTHSEKLSFALHFIEEHGFPVILKSDVGCVGKGVCKIASIEALEQKIPLLAGDYILQKIIDYPEEYGVFYTRHQGVER